MDANHARDFSKSELLPWLRIGRFQGAGAGQNLVSQERYSEGFKGPFEKLEERAEGGKKGSFMGRSGGAWKSVP